MLILENGSVIKELTADEIKALTITDTERMGIRPMTLPDISCSHQKTEVQGDVLLLEDFCFTYKNCKHGINIPRLELPTNRIIAIIGHNGAGKSTLARNICGLERRCKGTLTMNGKKLKAKDRLHNCYMIMQDVNHQLFTESVRDEVMLSMTDKSLTDEQKALKADEILTQLDLAEYADTHPMALSGGQKQRTAIASGIASSKPIIIFDEPTSGLDLRCWHLSKQRNRKQRILHSSLALSASMSISLSLLLNSCTNLLTISRFILPTRAVVTVSRSLIYSSASR